MQEENLVSIQLTWFFCWTDFVVGWPWLHARNPPKLLYYYPFWAGQGRLLLSCFTHPRQQNLKKKSKQHLDSILYSDGWLESFFKTGETVLCAVTDPFLVPTPATEFSPRKWRPWEMLLWFLYKILFTVISTQNAQLHQNETVRSCSMYNFIYPVILLLVSWYSRVPINPGFMASSVYVHSSVWLAPPWAIALRVRGQRIMIHFDRAIKLKQLFYTHRGYLIYVMLLGS